MNEPFAEVEIMKQVCRGQVSNVLELIDYFEDSLKFYVVTKYVPSGNL